MSHSELFERAFRSADEVTSGDRGKGGSGYSSQESYGVEEEGAGRQEDTE
jgi:hypothetical protein